MSLEEIEGTEEINIQLNNISLRRGHKLILDSVNLEINSKHLVLMTGENGSGKSTLLKILSGLIIADNFSLTLKDLKLKQSKKQFLRKNFCYLHQTPYLFSGSVYDNIAYGLKYTGLSQTEIKQQVNQALKIVKLEHLSQRDSHTLSGGEKQRVAIARSWVIKPKFMLLDEPFANMDKHSRISSYETINKLKQENIGVIITSHDPHKGELAFNRHLHLYQGKMTEHSI